MGEEVHYERKSDGTIFLTGPSCKVILDNLLPLPGSVLNIVEPKATNLSPVVPRHEPVKKEEEKED